MSNRNIAIRLTMDGGAEVTRTVGDISKAATEGFDKAGQAFAKSGEALDQFDARTKLLAQHFLEVTAGAQDVTVSANQAAAAFLGLNNVAQEALKAANADEVNRSWAAFLGINGQVTNSAREAGHAFIEANDNTLSWSSALSGARGLLGEFGFALGAAGVAGWAKSVLESTAQIENQAKVLGISTDALQAYHAAAVQSGAGADVGDAAIRRFTRSLGDAQAGAKLQAEAFRELGITGEELASGTEAVLPKAAAALLEISNAGERARLETQLFGRAGQDVEIILQKLADPDLIAHMKDMGLVIDSDLVERAHAFETAWATTWLTWKNEAIVAIGGVAVALSNLYSGSVLDRLAQSTTANGGKMFADARSSSSVGPDPMLQRILLNEQDMRNAASYGRADDAAAVAASLPYINIFDHPDPLKESDAVFKAEDIFAKDAEAAANRKSEAIANAYQKAWDAAGITSAPSNFALEGRTALEAAHIGASPVSMMRSDMLQPLTGVSELWNSKLLADERGISAKEDSGAAYEKQIKQLADINFAGEQRAGLEQRVYGFLQEQVKLAGLSKDYKSDELLAWREEQKLGSGILESEKQQVEALVQQRIEAQRVAELSNAMQSDLTKWLKSVETTGKASFASLFASILSSWQDMLNKMISQQIFQQLFGGGIGAGAVSGGGLLGGIIGGLLGGGAPVVDYHSGGMPGEGTATRNIPAGFFHAAPRYHFGIDEVPAVLQTGERVLSRAQNRAYSANASSGPSTIEVHVHIDGARGSQEITDAVHQGVANGLAAYDAGLDRRVLPLIDQKMRDPRFGG